MSRLYDRLMVSKAIKSHVKNKLNKCVVFSADNVAEYMFMRLTHGDPPSFTDIPNVAPPFNNFFIDIKNPQQLGWKGLYSWGVHVSSIDTQHESVPDYIEQQIQDFIHQVDLGDPSTFLFVSTEDLENQRKRIDKLKFKPIRWIVQQFLFLEHDKYIVKGPLWRGIMGVWDDGSCAFGFHQAISTEDMSFYSTLPIEKKRAVESEVHVHFIMTSLAISFLHCKNVKRIPVDQPQKLSRKFKKKYGQDLIKYHVLQINPMKQVLESTGQASLHGLKHALHICRGHFKTYTEEKPLLGHVTGTYWWGSHVRGSKERGLVMKDYDIKSPEVTNE